MADRRETVMATKDELDQLDGTNLEFSMPVVGRRIVRALESIDKHLVELNETLSSVVGEIEVPTSPGKTKTVLLIHDSTKS
jgi:hypothetical protein